MIFSFDISKKSCYHINAYMKFNLTFPARYENFFHADRRVITGQ